MNCAKLFKSSLLVFVCFFPILGYSAEAAVKKIHTEEIDFYKTNTTVLEQAITIYYTTSGQYLYYTVRKEAPLRKLSGKEFKRKEYLLLHNILRNSESGLKNFQTSGLTGRQAENAYYRLDGISGATVQNNSNKAVEGAVKLTDAIWEAVYEIKKQLPSTGADYNTEKVVKLIKEDPICCLYSENRALVVECYNYLLSNKTLAQEYRNELKEMQKSTEFYFDKNE